MPSDEERWNAERLAWASVWPESDQKQKKLWVFRPGRVSLLLSRIPDAIELPLIAAGEAAAAMAI